MHPVAYIHLASLLACLCTAVFLIRGRKRPNFLPALSILLWTLLGLMTFYSLSLFLEWSGYTVKLEWLEDFAGVLIPFTWAFMFFAITRNAIEDKLKASREHFREMVEATSDWIWEVDAAGRYTYASPRVEAILGYTPEEIMGKRPFDLMPPDEAARVGAIFSEIAEKGEPFESLQNRNLHKDGHEVILETNGVPIFDEAGRLTGYRGIDRDITERKKTAEQSAEQQAQLNTIFKASPAGISLVHDRKLVRANARFYEITGYSEEELLGTDSRLMYQTAQAYRDVGARYTEAMAEGFSRIRTRWVRKDQSVIEVVIYVAPLDPNDAEKGFVVVAQDITEQVHLRQWYQSIFDASPMGILTFTLQQADRLVLTGANKAANNIFGGDYAGAVGKTIEAVFPGFAGSSLPDEYRQICKQGGTIHGSNFEYHDRVISGFFEFDAFQISPGKMAVLFTEVSERLQRQQQLRFTQFAVDHSGEAAYWMSQDAKFIYVNERACRSMGYTRDELMRLSVPEIDPDFPADRWGDHWDEMRQKGEARFESRHKRKDGTVFPVEITSNFVTFEKIEYICAFARNISERKASERQREELMHRLQFTQFAFDNAGEEASWVGWDQKFIYVNEMFCQSHGYTHEELMRMSIPDVDPFYTPEDWAAHWEKLRTERIMRFEGRHVRKDGSVFPVEVTSKFVEYGGKEYICSFERDITERKADEQRRQIMQQQLKNRNEELQSIVYTAAHDLRSPLVNIGGFSGELEKSLLRLGELLQGQPLTEPAAKEIDYLLKTDISESLGFIKSGNDRMDALLGGLLRLSRIGTAVLKTEPIDMQDLFEHVLENFQYRTESEGLDLSVEPELPDCLGDFSLLTQVFVNLVDNAIKYADPDRKAVIKIGGVFRDDGAEYYVSDNGIGIQADQQDKVFGLFYRLNVSQPEGGGQGLGLTIVRRITDRLDGDVRIESTPGRGTTIYIKLPKV